MDNVQPDQTTAGEEAAGRPEHQRSSKDTISDQARNCSAPAGQKPALNRLKNNGTSKNNPKLGFAHSVEANCYSCADSALSGESHLDLYAGQRRDQHSTPPITNVAFGRRQPAGARSDHRRCGNPLSNGQKAADPDSRNTSATVVESTDDHMTRLRTVGRSRINLNQAVNGVDDRYLTTARPFIETPN